MYGCKKRPEKPCFVTTSNLLFVIIEFLDLLKHKTIIFCYTFVKEKLEPWLKYSHLRFPVFLSEHTVLHVR